MSKLQFEKRLPPISEEELTLIEGWLGLTFPQSYRQFILKYNGGYPNMYYFGNPEESNLFYISSFYGFSLLSDQELVRISENNNCNYNILKVTTDICSHDHIIGEYKNQYVTLRYRGDFPKRLLCIGENGSADFFFMPMSGEDFGVIHRYLSVDLEFWDENDNFVESNFEPPIKDFSEIFEYCFEEDVSDQYEDWLWDIEVPSEEELAKYRKP